MSLAAAEVEGWPSEGWLILLDCCLAVVAAAAAALAVTDGRLLAGWEMRVGCREVGWGLAGGPVVRIGVGKEGRES